MTEPSDLESTAGFELGVVADADVETVRSSYAITTGQPVERLSAGDWEFKRDDDCTEVRFQGRPVIVVTGTNAVVRLVDPLLPTACDCEETP